MAFLSRFGKSPKTLQSEVTVACPHCGRAMVFSYGDKLPDAESLVCRSCRADLRREFLHEAMEEQVKLHKKAQRKLLWYLITVLFTLGLLLYYIFTHEAAVWIWLLFAVNILLLLGGLALSFRNSRYIREIKRKQDQFNL